MLFHAEEENSRDEYVVKRASDIQLHNFGTFCNKSAPNRSASCPNAISAPRYTSFAARRSSGSGSATFDSLVATPLAGLYSIVRMPFLLAFVAAKIAVLETSWHRNVHRFLMSLSEGLVLTGELGDEQRSIKAAIALADRACKLRSSSPF